MKIMLVAKPWRGGLGRYFFLALQDMFPEQVEWISTRPQNFIERRDFRRDPAEWWQKLRTRIEASTCDVAFFIGYRNEFRNLKRRENQILYLIDDVWMKSGDMDAFGKVFLSDPGYKSELRTILTPDQYGGVLPFGFDPFLHAANRKHQPSKNICFIGNRDTKRDPYLARLFTEGLHPLIVGNYFLKSALFWQHPFDFRPAIANEAMAGIYERHQIALNIHAKVVREGTNMRTFECAGYGIPQVIEYRNEIETYLEPGKEILTYRNADEMVAQIRLLLNDTARAETMAQAARKRALNEHTYYHRVVTAFGHLLSSDVLQKAFTKGFTTRGKAA